MRQTGLTQEPLSLREREVAEAYAGGLSYKGIALKFGIAPATVRTHLGTIYRKLGVSTRMRCSAYLKGHLSTVLHQPIPYLQCAKRRAWSAGSQQ